MQRLKVQNKKEDSNSLAKLSVGLKKLPLKSTTLIKTRVVLAEHFTMEQFMAQMTLILALLFAIPVPYL